MAITKKFLAIVSFCTLLQACSHPLEIEGEGDIIDLNYSGHGCSLEEFQNSAESCTLNITVGAYDVDYHPVPRPGWEFVRWEGPCAEDSVPPNCKLQAPANLVQKFYFQIMPATRAVFAPIGPSYFVLIDAGATGFERESVLLNATTNAPIENISSISWTLLGGTSGDLSEDDTLTPLLTLPSIEVDENLLLQIDITLDDGDVLTAQTVVLASAYENIADLSLPDTVLNDCVVQTAIDNGWEDVGEFSTLSCPGVENISGLSGFLRLTQLELRDNQLSSLGELTFLDQLEFLDLSGNDNLPCSNLEPLKDLLEYGSSLLSDDICRANILMSLGGEPEDAAADYVRNRMYVSVPERKEIVVISLSELRILDRIRLASPPYGIDLSIDGSTLFAALNGKYYVASIDLATREVTEIPLGGETGDPRTYDVVEGAPGRLFVSANPGSSGFAYIVQVLLNASNDVSRVASNNIIRSRPKLARTAAQDFVYVGSGFSPNSLYRLSLSLPDAPIVLEDDHGSVYGTDNLALNATGTRIALSTGQVLRTGSFLEEGNVQSGKSVAGELDGNLYVASPDGIVEVYDFDSLSSVKEVQTECETYGSKQILTFSNDDSIAILQDDGICLHTRILQSQPADPFADFRFPDLALEECIIATAMFRGFESLEDISVLDCSNIPKTILNLDDIGRLSNLEHLNISNSGVLDLEPLVAVPLLNSLVAQNTQFANLAPLELVDTLAELDVTDNPVVSCASLGDLVTLGVSVTAQDCIETQTVELSGIGHDLAYDPLTGSAFVSVPSLAKVLEIDLDLGTIDAFPALPAQPRGIDLSADGSTIFAALHGLGDIAYISRADGLVETVDISTELGDDRTWDIAEVASDQVVVSSNPNSNGIAYIVEVRRDLANAAQRVASNRIIRASPIFVISQDKSAVFVGSGFSPNSLYKLDATDADMPIVLEDDHGSVSGTNSLALSPDGDHIYLSSGQALATDTFLQVQTFRPGRSAVSTNGSNLLVDDGEIAGAGAYDRTTTNKVGSRIWGCDLVNVTAMRDLNDKGILVLGDDLLCFSRRTAF